MGKYFVNEVALRGYSHCSDEVMTIPGFHKPLGVSLYSTLEKTPVFQSFLSCCYLDAVELLGKEVYL